MVCAPRSAACVQSIFAERYRNRWSQSDVFHAPALQRGARREGVPGAADVRATRTRTAVTAPSATDCTRDSGVPWVRRNRAFSVKTRNPAKEARLPVSRESAAPGTPSRTQRSAARRAALPLTAAGGWPSAAPGQPSRRAPRCGRRRAGRTPFDPEGASSAGSRNYREFLERGIKRIAANRSLDWTGHGGSVAD